MQPILMENGVLRQVLEFLCCLFEKSDHQATAPILQVIFDSRFVPGSIVLDTWLSFQTF